MLKKNWVNLRVRKSTSKKYEVQIEKDGTAQDITDWTIYMTVKESMEDSDANAKINKKITSHSEPEAGKSLIKLTATDLNLTVGTYYYSVDYKDAEGSSGILKEGQFVIQKPVRDTRD